MSNQVISPETAENRDVTNATRSLSSKAELAAAVTRAAQSQRDGQSTIINVAIERGETAGEACRLAGIVSGKGREAVLAAIDEIIDKSQNGIARNQRRQEIRRDICLAHLNGLVNFSDLPVGHAKSLVGSFVKFELDKGTCDASDLDKLRSVLTDWRAAKCDVKGFRAMIAAALGKSASGKKREKSLVDSLREILADEETSDARREKIYSQHPDLHPDFVNPVDVAAAVDMLAKLTRASQVAALAKVAIGSPETWELAMVAALEIPLPPVSGEGAKG